MTDAETIARLARTVDVLAEWRGEVNAERAAERVRMAQIDKRLDDIGKTLHEWQDETRTDRKWLLRIVIALVVGAVVKWVLEGGLAGV